MKKAERTLIDVTKYLYSLQDKQLDLVMRYGDQCPETHEEFKRLERIIQKLGQWRLRLVEQNLTPTFEGTGFKLVKSEEE